MIGVNKAKSSSNNGKALPYMGNLLLTVPRQFFGCDGCLSYPSLPFYMLILSMITIMTIETKDGFS